MTQSIPLETPEHVKSLFKSLCDDEGFRITESTFDQEAFGNIRIVGRIPEFGIEYVRDRGDESLFVMVSAKSYLMTDACQLVLGTQLTDTSIEQEENFVRENANGLRTCFSKDRLANSIEFLEGLRVERMHRMFPGAVVSNS